MLSDDQLSGYLQKACKDAFDVLFDSGVEYGPVLGFDGVIKGEGRVASITLQGKHNGLLVLQLNKAASQSIIGQLLGEENLGDEEITDGVSELANILAGNVKTVMSAAGNSFEISIPQVNLLDNKNASFVPAIQMGKKSIWHHAVMFTSGKQFSVYLTFDLAEQPTKVLIMEDDRSISMILGKSFESKGYDPTIALDGKIGLELAATNKFDIVISDINMPNVDGVQAIQALKVLLPDLKIIVYSAMAKEEIENRLGDNADNVVEIITKPASTELIFEAVEKALKSNKPINA